MSSTKIALSISALGLCFLGYQKSKDITANKKQMTVIFSACALGGIYILYNNLSKQTQAANKSQMETPKTKSGNGLAPRKYRKYKLVQKIDVSHNTKRYRFALQTPNTVLGLTPGKHVSFRYFDKDENGDEDEIRRPYTPVTSNREKGYFECVIKVYPGGKMSQHLETLVIGRDYIEARGPLGYIHYKAPGLFEIKQKRVFNEYKVNKINMIAGGTGITPMYQLIKEILAMHEDNTQVSLIFGNVSIDDILLYDELKDIREKYDNIKIRFIIDKAPTDGRKWDEDVGYITPAILGKQLFHPSEDVIVLNCGPPIMVKICTKNLIHLGYDETKIIAY